MKICPACGAALAESWKCDACGADPAADPYYSFAGDDGEQDGYDDALFARLAPLEDSNFWFRARSELIGWSLETSFPAARSFFELGCGSGVVLQALRRRLPELELAGADLSPAGLDIARSRLPDVPLYRLGAHRLPFRDEFDVAGVFDVLEHLDDDVGALEQLRAAVRPGGGVIATVPQHPRLWSVADDVAHHRRRYTRRSLAAKFGRAGLRIRRTTSFATAVLPAMAAARWWYRLRPASYSLERELAVPAAIGAVLGRAMAAERAAIRAGLSLPAGGSLLVVAERPL